MNDVTRIKKLIQNIADRERPALFSAKVKSVKGDTCTVQIGKLELTDVRLRAIVNGKDDTLLITPKEGSIVLLADLSDGEMRDLTVIAYSEVKETLLKIDKLEFKADTKGFLIENKGENLKNILSDFIQEVMNIIVIQGTSPNVPELIDIRRRLGEVLT